MCDTTSVSPSNSSTRRVNVACDSSSALLLPFLGLALGMVLRYAIQLPVSSSRLAGHLLRLAQMYSMPQMYSIIAQT